MTIDCFLQATSDCNAISVSTGPAYDSNASSQPHNPARPKVSSFALALLIFFKKDASNSSSPWHSQYFPQVNACICTLHGISLNIFMYMPACVSSMAIPKPKESRCNCNSPWHSNFKVRVCFLCPTDPLLCVRSLNPILAESPSNHRILLHSPLLRCSIYQ